MINEKLLPIVYGLGVLALVLQLFGLLFAVINRGGGAQTFAKTIYAFVGGGVSFLVDFTANVPPAIAAVFSERVEETSLGLLGYAVFVGFIWYWVFKGLITFFYNTNEMSRIEALFALFLAAALATLVRTIFIGYVAGVQQTYPTVGFVVFASVFFSSLILLANYTLKEDELRRDDG